MSFKASQGTLDDKKNMIAEMQATCPNFISMQWLSMGHLLNWLVAKCRDVMDHFDDKNPPCRPPQEWWIEAFVLQKFVNQINITFVELQGRQLLLDE